MPSRPRCRCDDPARLEARASPVTLPGLADHRGYGPAFDHSSTHIVSLCPVWWLAPPSVPIEDTFGIQWVEAINTYQQSEGSAPPSLETLSDAVRKASQSAQLAHYTLQYAPGKPDPAGRVTAYALTARAGNFGYRSFYTDESATLRATTEDRAATVQDPPLNLQP